MVIGKHDECKLFICSQVFNHKPINFATFFTFTLLTHDIIDINPLICHDLILNHVKKLCACFFMLCQLPCMRILSERFHVLCPIWCLKIVGISLFLSTATFALVRDTNDSLSGICYCNCFQLVCACFPDHATVPMLSFAEG